MTLAPVPAEPDDIDLQVPPQLLLSPPHVGELERIFLLDALQSGWVAPAGPHVDAFEREMATATGVRHAVALSSGTAALHLALQLVGVGPGDEVLVSTLTFVASASPVCQLGARPVFVDAHPGSWNLDPRLLEAELEQRARNDRLPAAVVAVDLYGQCADFLDIVATCRRYGIPVVEDAAEALGATYLGCPAGSLADVGVLSFNGNKTITTSGGGMLLTDDAAMAERARYLATQARQPVDHYEHVELGYNFRLSNLLAALGRAQLRSLDERVARRRRTRSTYAAHLGGLPGIRMMPQAHNGRSSWWLTALTIDSDAFGASRDEVCRHLRHRGIESRPVWKPLHLQPVFATADHVGGEVAAELFRTGLCLPSGSAMSDDDVERVLGTFCEMAGS